MVSPYEVLTESQIRIMPEHMIEHKFNRREARRVEGQEPEGGVIPLEALKGLVDSLNRLFNTFVSRECFEVKSFRVKIRRQKLLTSFAGKDSDRAEEEHIYVSVVTTLESDEPVEEYMASAAELVSNIVEAGFEVSDITIALSPQEVGVEVTLPLISAK